MSISGSIYVRVEGRIVKQFMREMGGEIDVVSTLGEGSKFICTIPFDLPLTTDFVQQ